MQSDFVRLSIIRLLFYVSWIRSAKSKTKNECEKKTDRLRKKNSHLQSMFRTWYLANNEHEHYVPIASLFRTASYFFSLLLLTANHMRLTLAIKQRSKVAARCLAHCLSFLICLSRFVIFSLFAPSFRRTLYIKYQWFLHCLDHFQCNAF